MSNPIHIAINGAGGRMGRTIIQACVENEGTTLAAALERFDSPLLGSDAGELAGVGPLNVAVASVLENGSEAIHAWIDFTLPDGAISGVAQCVDKNIPMVIGTTGFTAEQKEKIHQASHKIPIMLAPNMSVGVNLCLNLLQTAAATLGEDYDIEIVEAHHRDKVDAPSGTAVRMGEVIAETLGISLQDKAVYERHGHTGARKPGSIGFQTIRAGDIVGDHTVYFAGTGERVEITHRASSRLTFARGALRAAMWLQGKAAGLYDMQDVLGLSRVT